MGVSGAYQCRTWPKRKPMFWGGIIVNVEGIIILNLHGIGYTRCVVWIAPDFCIVVKLLNSLEFPIYKPEKKRKIMASVCGVVCKTEHSTCHGCPVAATKYFIWSAILSIWLII